MTENRVVALRQKGAIDDPLTEILRTGARRLIAQAVEAEFETFLASTAELVLPDGRQRVVRHGHDPVRAIQTGIGAIEVQKPKARDRAAASGERLRFSSKHPALNGRAQGEPRAFVPVLHLSGISSAFSRRSSLASRQDAPNLSAAVIARLKSEWEDEYARRKRDLSELHCVFCGRLLAGVHGVAVRKHAGADARRRRQEGAGRPSTGHAGERARLE